MQDKIEVINYTDLPDILRGQITSFTIMSGEKPSAIYLGRMTRRQIGFALVHELHKIVMKSERDFFEGIPIYIVDCEDYLAVS